MNQLSTARLAQVLPEGVHPSHFAIINHLTVRGDARSPVDIARAMQVTKTTMTHSLKVLEGRGYIAIAPNPDDARGKHVTLTEAGRAFRAKAIAEVSAMMNGILGSEQLDQITACLPHLQALRAHLDASRD